MSRFLKLEAESFWVNVERVDGIGVRPQLRSIGATDGQTSLESLHEATGSYEVIVAYQERIMPVRSFETQQEAEAFIQQILSRLSP